MKKLAMIAVAVVAMCLSAAGCASFATGPATFYSDTVKPGIIRGEATGRVWLGVFGEETYPPVERVAKENGISKIATVEHYAKLGIIGLWMDYTTIVTGE
jgi:ABC-type glycerol-3-phosphate transport system substrate-binding protein